jgi:hypothetical protein
MVGLVGVQSNEFPRALDLGRQIRAVVRVEVDSDIEISAKTVGELPTVTAWAREFGDFDAAGTQTLELAAEVSRPKFEAPRGLTSRHSSQSSRGSLDTKPLLSFTPPRCKLVSRQERSSASSLTRFSICPSWIGAFGSVLRGSGGGARTLEGQGPSNCAAYPKSPFPCDHCGQRTIRSRPAALDKL